MRHKQEKQSNPLLSSALFLLIWKVSDLLHFRPLLPAAWHSSSLCLTQMINFIAFSPALLQMVLVMSNECWFPDRESRKGLLILSEQLHPKRKCNQYNSIS